MKTFKKYFGLLFALLLFNIDAYAASASLSVSSGSVYVGDTFTVTANVNAAAAWNVHVSATGPVSGCTINQADASADAMDTNKTFTATCTATGTGTITLNLSGDVTSAGDGNAVNISGSRTVTVTEKSTPTPAPNPTPNPADNRSKNNNLKELSVDGYELVKVDNQNYTLSVSSDVDSINIKATAEHNKAKVTGTGKHDLIIGENIISIVVTAENGAKNTITIKVTRKDGYAIEDLDDALKKDNQTVDIVINSDTKISQSDLEKVKNSKKVVNFNYYDSEKQLVYSWIVDGSKLENIDAFSSGISFNSDNKKEMLEKSNYADGLYISLEQKSDLPKGTKIKLLVNSKYEDNDSINVYSYVPGNKELKLLGNFKIENGYLVFNVDEASDYLLTKSKVPNSKTIAQINTNNNQAEEKSLVLPIVVVIIIGGLIGFTVFFMKKKKS